MNPVFELIQKGLPEEVKTLLKENADFAKIPDDSGLSPILAAIYHNQTVIVKLLLPFLEKLSIYEACAAGNITEIAQNLAEKPELIHSFAPDGYTPLSLACFFGHYEAVEYLIDKHADVNLASVCDSKVRPIHAAVAANQNEIAEFLIVNGANVNVPQHLNIYPIHSAVHRKNYEMVNLLLQNYADLTVVTDAGQTALSIAETEDSKEIEKLIRVFML